MAPMYKVILTAGPALIASYTAHPSRIVNPHGGVFKALELDLMDLLDLPDAACIPAVVYRDMVTALRACVNGPKRHEVSIGMTHWAGRHPMYRGGAAVIQIRVVRC